jgi:hypothetical protein
VEPDPKPPTKKRAKKPTVPPTDVNLLPTLPPGHDVKGEFRTTETRDERRSRLKIAEDEAAHKLSSEAARNKHEHRKDFLILVFVLVALSAVAIVCGYIACFGADSEDRKWAMTVLAAIVSLGAGYIGGKGGRP